MFIKIRLAMAKKSINKILGVDNDISKTEQWFSKIKNILKGSNEVYDDVFYDDDAFYDDDDDEEYERSESNVFDCLRRDPVIDNLDISLSNAIDRIDESFSEKVLKLIDERGVKDSVIYKKANIDRRLFSKIRSDVNYVPSKKTAISLAIALKLNLEETNDLLGHAGYTLSSSSRFDIIISWMITHKKYNIDFINLVLNEYGEGSLNR